MPEIAALHILPPFAIARLGSSPVPMDNFELRIPGPIDTRQIVPAETIVVDESGEAHTKAPPFEVDFRDAGGFIRPIAPFLEVWARLEGDPYLTPLTADLLSLAGSSPGAVRWTVHVANIKAFRRTGDPNDRAETRVELRDHRRIPLLASCKNFLPGKTLPLGWVQYIQPNAELPEIRLRFTPAAGKVYGPPRTPKDPNLADEIYDPKGPWNGYSDPFDPTKSTQLEIRRTTNPAQIYAGYDLADGNHISWGYLDDECDGVAEVAVDLGGRTLTAYGRIAAGPPTFAPDGYPVRTVADELDQALHGPEADELASAEEMEEVRNIVRRAMETVRLMNTGQMNLFSAQRGVGMARMDYLDYARLGQPIADSAVADSLAIRSRHERVLLALESGSMAWFARVLREYDQVGDLTDLARRKMPALMRGADGRHLALTRRQTSLVRAAAKYFGPFSDPGGQS